MAGLRSAKTTARLFIGIFLYIKLQIILPISVQLEHFIVHNNKIMVLTLVLCFHYDIWKQLQWLGLVYACDWLDENKQ